MNAQQAIQRSQSHTEIVTLDHDAEAIEALLVAADDWVDANDVTEFWGADERGTWRVHVRHAEAS